MRNHSTRLTRTVHCTIAFCALFVLVLVSATPVAPCCSAFDLAVASMPYKLGAWDCPPSVGNDGCDCSGLVSRDFGLATKQNVAYFIGASSTTSYTTANILTITGHIVRSITYYTDEEEWFVYSCGDPCHDWFMSLSYFNTNGYSARWYSGS